MKSEIIEISDNDGKVLTQGKYYQGSKQNGRVVVAQAGLGATIDSSGFIKSLTENSDRHGKYSVFAIEHPGHGLNVAPDKKIIYTLQDCEDATLWGIQRILERTETKKVILAGNSLGFWSLFQALAKVHGINENILALLGKSGVVSYKVILGRMLQQFHRADSDAWGNFMKYLKIGADGWGEIQVNSEDPPIPIHQTLLNLVSILNERDTTGKLVEDWHGQFDQYTSLAEMQLHNGGGITVHEERGVGHSLNQRGDNTNSQRVNSEIIHRINEIFEDSEY